MPIKLSFYLLQKMLAKNISSFEDYFGLLWLEKPSIAQQFLGEGGLSWEGTVDALLVDVLFEDPADYNNSIFEYYFHQTKSYFLQDEEENQLKVNSFISGFREYITEAAMTAAFIGEQRNARDLDLLLVGPTANVESLFAQNIQYLVNAETKRWFEEIVREKAQEDPSFVKKLLIFWTGSHSLPEAVDRDLSLKYERAGQERLPGSHTCFNELTIPRYYPSKEIFKSKLITALNGAQGLFE